MTFPRTYSVINLKRKRNRAIPSMSPIHGPILTLRAPTAAHISSDGEEKRHQVMQNLFGNQCEEEEEELNSDDESNPQPKSFSGITTATKIISQSL